MFHLQESLRIALQENAELRKQVAELKAPEENDTLRDRVHALEGIRIGLELRCHRQEEIIEALQQKLATRFIADGGGQRPNLLINGPQDVAKALRCAALPID